jgi:hypothetical protein
VTLASSARERNQPDKDDTTAKNDSTSAKQRHFAGRRSRRSAPANPGTVTPALADPALADPVLADPASADPATENPAAANPATDLPGPANAGPANPGAQAGPRTGQPVRSSGRPEPDGPHVIFGIAWALVTLVAIFGGSVWLALWMAPTAALAAGSAVNTWRGRGSSRASIAAGLAAAIVLAAIAGPIATGGTVVAALLFIVIEAVVHPDRAGAEPGLVRRILIVALPAAAGAGFVLTRHQGFDEALVLGGMMVVYDSAAYLIGTGASNRWEGPAAGIVSVGILSVLAAAVLAPPFTGSSPWILGGMAAVLLPLGPVVCRQLVGRARSPARVPALRRLDSLVLLAPAWPVAIALLLPKH